MSLPSPLPESVVPITEASLTTMRTYRDVMAEISALGEKDIEFKKMSSKFSVEELLSLKAKRAVIVDQLKNIEKESKEVEKLALRRLKEDESRRAELDVNLRSATDRIAMDREILKNLQQDVDLAVKKATVEAEAAGKGYKYFSAAVKFGVTNLGIQSKEITNVLSISGELAKFPKLSGAWGKSLAIVVTYLFSAFELFKKFDKAAMDFRKTMGITRDNMDGMKKSIQASAVSMMNLGVTIETLYTATKDLGAEMGGIHNVSADIRDEVAAMKDILGVSTDISAKFLKNMAAISGKTISTQKNTLYIAGSLSEAAGTNLGDVMGDVANASGTTLSLMGKMPNQMLRAAIEARRFNTSINEVARANRHVLDFSTSIQEEMEASVLLGHSINLQKLRALSFEGDMEAAMKERIKIAEKEDFLNIKNVFQKEALAKALGTSVEDLTKQLQVNKEIERIRREGSPLEKKKLEDYERKLALNEADMNVEGKKFHDLVMNGDQQERIAKISNSYHKILAQIGQVLLPVIDVALTYIGDHMPVILSSLATFWVFGSKIGSIFKWVETVLMNIGSPKNWKWIAWVGEKMYAIGDAMGRFRGALGGIFSAGGRLGGLFARITAPFRSMGLLMKTLLAPLWVIWNIVKRILTPIIFAYNIYKEIKKMLSDPKLMNIKDDKLFNRTVVLRAFGAIMRALWNALNFFFMGLPGMILGGIQAIGGMLSEAIQAPFKTVWAWLKETFLGESPSSLGLMIVAGIVSIGTILHNVIISPFKDAWEWIKKSFLGVATFLGKSALSLGLLIVNGLKSVRNMMFDALTSPFKAGWAWIKKNVPGVEWAANKVSGAGDNVKKSMEAKMADTYIPAATITPQGTTLATQEKTGGVAAEVKAADTTTLADVVKSNAALLDAINGLRKDLNDGKVTVHMDGALMSTMLARNLDFRGGFGVNR